LVKRARNPNLYYEVALPISGRSLDEWDKVARWIKTYNLQSPQIRWYAGINLNYSALKKNLDSGIKNFEQYIRNIFEPLFEVLDHPEKHPELHEILPTIVGFTTTNFESRSDARVYPIPTDWNSEDNPPYFYFLYHIWSNLNSLNAFLQRKNFAPLVYRPISGFTGSNDEIACSFLLADSIAHGVQIKSSAVLQYLFYLTQMGISMAVLKEDMINCDYKEHPFNKFLKRGLNLSLCTESPLQLHFTNEPLQEEYALISQIWKINSADLSEISRYSVLMSGFDEKSKIEMIGRKIEDHIVGDTYYEPGKTNLPEIRYLFRLDTLKSERDFLEKVNTK